MNIGDGTTTRAGSNARLEFLYAETTGHAYYDTGSGFIIPPKGICQKVVGLLTEGLTSTFDAGSGITSIDCGQKNQYEDIEIRIDGKWIQILAKDYIYDNGAGTCYLAFK
jgi:hypothetical protein